MVVLEILKYLWALPYTLFGFFVGGLGLLTGGRVARKGAIFEFHGGAVTWFLNSVPNGKTICAMTLGHVIFGKTQNALDIARAHEMVHVAQYGRWGFFFGPAYLLSSLVQQLKGNRPYRDNMFEREAYAKAPIHSAD